MKGREAAESIGTWSTWLVCDYQPRRRLFNLSRLILMKMRKRIYERVIKCEASLATLVNVPLWRERFYSRALLSNLQSSFSFVKIAVDSLNIETVAGERSILYTDRLLWCNLNVNELQFFLLVVVIGSFFRLSSTESTSLQIVGQSHW